MAYRVMKVVGNSVRVLSPKLATKTAAENRMGYIKRNNPSLKLTVRRAR